MYQVRDHTHVFNLTSEFFSKLKKKLEDEADMQGSCKVLSCYIKLVAADRWRVILKAEHPDYIHANFVNVSTCMETNSLLNRLTNWLLLNIRDTY